ncbi:glutamyl-tRNA(Gln) amidotransferase subunit A, mitochondrial isoform X2 [Aplysia californica]|nr:glutamyl-tRNA(Gln) amidotransferase subunit A, mitochondrial isoform X2 [Aplysia californica]
MRKGLLSVEELCKKCQDILKKTRVLNMYVNETDPEQLSKNLQASSQAYAQEAAKCLEGIPVSFKDAFCTSDMPTTCGSKMLLNYTPPYDATMVTRTQENGAIVIGKTNMDEFAMGSGSLDGCHGPVMNPWNFAVLPAADRHVQGANNVSEDTLSVEPGDWFISGGSSGGSAAAVASGSCLASFGSDTGGSTRLPASFCGVVGLKPTYGLLSRHGLIPLVNSMDAPGIITKTVEDCSIVLNAVAGHDVMDSTTVVESYKPFEIQEDIDLSKLHIGIPKEYHGPGLSGEVLRLWQDTADNLEKAGARVTQVSMPHTQLCITCYHVLCCCEVASNMARYDGIEFGLREGSEESTEELYAASRHQGFNDVVRSRILAGNFFLLKRNYEKFFLKAQRVRRLISNDFKNVFRSGVDVLLTPISLTDAPRYRWFANQDNHTRCEEQDVLSTPANMAGVPAISIPLSLSSQGLPLSLQLIGPHFSESSLLTVAGWLEREAQFPYLNLDALGLNEEALRR